jgi:non-heme chloroperoxidase
MADVYRVLQIELFRERNQIVPIGASAMMSSKLVRNAKLKVYKGLPHGMPTTHAEIVNKDLLEFIETPG